MTKVTHATHLGLAALLLVAGVAAASEARLYKGYETPPYEILHRDGAIEVRQYAPHVVAEVEVEGSRRGAVSKGFRTLAGYIFGGNDQSQKVSMTAPVAQVPMQVDGTGAQNWKVRFTMPSQYDVATLPNPDNSDIRFTKVETQKQAVIRFSGFWSNRSLTSKADALQSWAQAEELSLDGGPTYYFYDDPFTLPFHRRNEVAFVVR
ncbi:SOUL family heme-binding protein [Meridianimarinicoccus aquatilis]|uniref:Heme-binding protein n=1 Tax=Meridianimarinicoccus aquatilis TaxID=2552766 RepID=A0A4R6AX09_9RHOB|nr:heme-binding protein [Fluviibacterium aquatile]TDL89261.1 heme-binding protein [Fluviibacterium aquatile]